MESILGLNLGFGLNLPPNKRSLPIDFNRLRRNIRARFIDFENNDDFDPKLYVRKTSSKLAKAPSAIEATIDTFEQSCKNAFENSWKKPHFPNLKKSDLQILKTLRKERKFITLGTDKNLGPAIIELDHYIARCLTDHLNNEEVSESEARVIDKMNFAWICKNCIDFPLSKLTKSSKDFFRNSLLGIRICTGEITPLEKLDLPYFYMLPKVHKKPDWKTRPVVSGISSTMEPLSKFLD